MSGDPCGVEPVTVAAEQPLPPNQGGDGTATETQVQRPMSLVKRQRNNRHQKRAVWVIATRKSWTDSQLFPKGHSLSSFG